MHRSHTDDGGDGTRRTTSGQPAARPADWSWRLHAACRGVDTAVFYGPDDERPTRKANGNARRCSAERNTEAP
jgi:hypothetical protein